MAPSCPAPNRRHRNCPPPKKKCPLAVGDISIRGRLILIDLTGNRNRFFCVYIHLKNSQLSDGTSFLKFLNFIPLYRVLKKIYSILFFSAPGIYALKYRNYIVKFISVVYVSLSVTVPINL